MNPGPNYFRDLPEILAAAQREGQRIENWWNRLIVLVGVGLGVAIILAYALLNP